jgi:hypothetical protein
MLHLVKSISWPHPWHTCLLSNSSENISFSFPQLGHLQINALRSFKSSNPGQCRGVVIIASCSSLSVCRFQHLSLSSLKTPVFLACRAYPQELEPEPRYAIITLIPNRILEVTNRYHRGIFHPPARYATEVIMVFCITIKSHLVRGRTNSFYQTPGTQSLQVPINGPQAYSRKPLANQLVHLVRCGMCFYLSDLIQDDLSLVGHPVFLAGFKRAICVHLLSGIVVIK